MPQDLGVRMRIAVASGKGGTGKTTIAVSLASALADDGERVTYVDCDVEEPNGHVFLGPTFERTENVEVPVPSIDAARCTACGRCVEVCEFHALALVVGGVLAFPELCHGCGGCTLVCPEGAITEVPRALGVIEEGTAGRLRFMRGRLTVGEAMSTPVIRTLKKQLPTDGFVILDSPPGTSCPVIETLKDVDHLLLVTEPTPVGLNDLELAVGTARTLGLSMSAVINRCDAGDTGVQEYLEREGIDVWLGIPHDRAVAEAYARGVLPAAEVPGYAEGIRSLVEEVVRLRTEEESIR